MTRLNISGSFVVNSRKNFGTFPIFFSRSLRPFSVPFLADVAFAGVFLVAGFFTAIYLLLLQLHWFTAANKFAAADFFHYHNISTDITPEYLSLFRDINHAHTLLSSSDKNWEPESRLMLQGLPGFTCAVLR
jgi:hypothetical protein